MTLGCIMHATRGNAATPQAEYLATVSWFCNPASQVSAHAVVSTEGEITQCVSPERIAWHAREYNAEYLGLELVQPRIGDAITDAQYSAAAWWLVMMAERFGFPLTADRFPEHRQIPPGVRDGKTDVGAPYDVNRLLAYVQRWSAQLADANA